MKDYVKKQYSGNENGWSEPATELSTHRMHEEQAEELNSHFRNTGVKFEEITATPQEQNEATEAPKPKKPVASKAKK